jgi:hypothetical protein
MAKKMKAEAKRARREKSKKDALNADSLAPEPSEESRDDDPAPPSESP